MTILGISMQLILGWILIIFPGMLFLAQVISSINFSFAQKLGLQEDPNESDPLLQRAEQYAAYLDLITLVWLPISGVLMILNHSSWPIVSFFGGAIYFDTAGREAVKFLSFKHEGLKLGSPKQQRLFFSTYIMMAILGFIVVLYALGALCNVL